MRAFVAVEILNKDLIKKISEFQSLIKIKAKPVEPNNLHFTLQFLGEVSKEVSEKVGDALSSIEFSSFKVRFKGIGVFPKPKFPRVIWVGTENDDGRKLVDLSKKVNEVLEPLGFKNDKPFSPHVTVFRIKNKVRDITEELEKYQTHYSGVQEINCIKFKQSVLHPSGPVYSDLKVIESK